METIDFAVHNITLDMQVDITVPVTINGAGVTINCPNAKGGGGIDFQASGNVVMGLTIIGVPGSTIGLNFGGLFGFSNDNTVTGATVSGFGGAQMSFADNNNTIQGNMIGTNSAGTAKAGGYDGLAIYGSGNTIGGSEVGQGNVISGLTGDYAAFLSSSATNNTVQGNFIGTDITGTHGIGNAGSGFAILGASNNTVIDNVISANGHVSATSSYAGIDIGGVGANNNLIERNLIGTNVRGTAPLPNIGDGVDIYGGASGNTIGAASSALNSSAPFALISGNGNLISGNSVDGLDIFNSDSNPTQNNLVEGNFVGTDISGTKPLPNAVNGISIVDGASNNTIGGANASYGNLISGNKNEGILLGLELVNNPSGSPANSNVVEANYIGTDLDGQVNTPPAANPLANEDGVYINGGSNNVIGDAQQAGNLAGGALTALPLPTSNLIAGNLLDGVLIASGTGNCVSLNRIFANQRMGIELGRDTGINAPTANSSSGPNQLQNYPVLTSVLDNAGQTTIVGTLTPQGGQTSYWIEFYANSQLSSFGNLSEGEWFLGAQSFTVGADGLVHILFTCTTPGLPSMLPSQNYSHVAGNPANAGIAPDHLITALADDGHGNTSEFSPCRDILRNAVGENVVSTSIHNKKGPISISKVFQPNTILGSPLTLTQAAQDCGGPSYSTGCNIIQAPTTSWNSMKGIISSGPRPSQGTQDFIETLDRTMALTRS